MLKFVILLVVSANAFGSDTSESFLDSPDDIPSTPISTPKETYSSDQELEEDSIYPKIRTRKKIKKSYKKTKNYSKKTQEESAGKVCWTVLEDLFLLRYINYRGKKWKKIAKKWPAAEHKRQEDAVKHRYYTYVKYCHDELKQLEILLLAKIELIVSLKETFDHQDAFNKLLHEANNVRKYFRTTVEGSSIKETNKVVLNWFKDKGIETFFPHLKGCISPELRLCGECLENDDKL